MQQITDAEYRPSKVASDNPLIAALPAQLSREDLYALLVKEFTLPPDYKTYTPQERQELSVRIKQIYVPMEYAADIYASLFYGFLTAYSGRTAVSITKRMNDIGKAIEKRSCETLPDSPFIAESFAILGEPGAGKSTTVRNILKMFPSAIRHTEFNGMEFRMVQIPYILIECPVNHSEKSVCFQILEKIDSILDTNYMGEAMHNSLSIDLLIIKIAQLCMKYSIGAILIDEIQNVMKVNVKNPSSGNTLIRFLVGLANKTGVCLVCIGTSAVSDFFNSEAHLARRTRGPRIPLLSKGPTFRTVLEKMWANIAVLIEKYGEAYWHRAHQIWVMDKCHKHGCNLLDADMSLSKATYHFTCADEISCPNDKVTYNESPFDSFTQYAFTALNAPFSFHCDADVDALIYAAVDRG